MRTRLTPTGNPPPLAVRLAKALPFQRTQGEMRGVLTAHNYRHTANGAPTHASVVSSHTPKQGRRHDPCATAAGVSRAFRPFLHIIGPLWGPSSNYPLCG